MRKRDRISAKAMELALARYESANGALPGIASSSARETLVEQLIESTRRVKYAKFLGSRTLSPRRCNPADSIFDPLMAAICFSRAGDLDEALWLMFLATHFGKSHQSQWLLVADVYGALHSGLHWTWSRIVQKPASFVKWLKKHVSVIRSQVPARCFSNHRKYQSLSAVSPTGTGAAVLSYVKWIQSHGGHERLISTTQQQAAGDPQKQFDILYKSMKDVVSFGRVARFDYLVLAGELGIIPIEPGRTYLQDATGPLMGARLLVEGATEARTGARALEPVLADLDRFLKVGFHVLEDALCNWQKSHTYFVPFRG